MVYFVTLHQQQQLFNNPAYEFMTPEESLDTMQSWNLIQVDTETSGRDAHLCRLLCIQWPEGSTDADNE